MALAKLGTGCHRHWSPSYPEGQVLGENSCTVCVSKLGAWPRPQPAGTGLLPSCPDFGSSVSTTTAVPYVTIITVHENLLCAISSRNPPKPPG